MFPLFLLLDVLNIFFECFLTSVVHTGLDKARQRAHPILLFIQLGNRGFAVAQKGQDIRLIIVGD